MRLELIRQNKLKITLCKEDLSTYGISADSIAKNSDEAQAMFFSVLRKAEEEVGFAYTNSRLVVEAVPSSGGMVIFVTKVDTEAEQQLFDKISSRQGINLRRKRDEQTGRTSFMAELDSFDDVVEMCHSVPTYFGGTLYSSEDKYYIAVGVGMERIIAEYGRILDENAQSIIEEHGVPVIYRRAFDIIRNRFKQ
ncbi:MAG: adaptor protein MecA [Clostridia bacterium]